MITPFRPILGLEEHFPAAQVRREASSRPLCLVPPLMLPLPLPWHRPSIAGLQRHSKAITYCSTSMRFIICHLPDKPS